mgnify:CR=1 FL=1
MSDSISQIGKPTTPASVRPEQVTKSDKEASAAVPKQPGLNVDQFTLSPAAESALATASFDETKVALLKAAISEAVYRGYKKVKVFHDLQGIKHWAEGSWKTKKPATIKYKEFIDEHRKIIETVI